MKSQLRTFFVFWLLILGFVRPAHSSLELQGFWDAGPCQTVAVAGNLAFFSAGSTLKIADISGGSPWPEIGELHFQSLISDVKVQAEHVYVLTEREGMTVVDVSDPSHPVAVGFLPATYVTERLVINGSAAYVLDGGLRVVDISDTQNPQQVDFLEAPSFEPDLCQQDGRLYVVGRSNGLSIFDLTDPHHPSLLGQFPTYSSRHYEDVDVHGNYAYICAGNNGVRVFDVSDPTAAIEVTFNDLSILDWARGCLWFNDDLYVIGEIGLVVLDVSTPTNTPVLRVQSATVETGRDLYLQNQTLWVADQQQGLRGISMSDPYDPTTVGMFDTHGLLQDVALCNGHAVVALGDRGLAVIDYSQPSQPEVVTKVLDLKAQCLAVEGNLVFVGGLGLNIYDLSDPTSPALLGSAGTSSMSHVTVHNGVVHVSGSGYKLGIFDATNPLAPVEIFTEPQSGTVHYSPHTYGNGYVYIRAQPSHWYPSLMIYDVHNPVAPNLVTAYETEGLNGLTSRDGLLFYTEMGLGVLSLDDPENPVPLSWLDLTFSGEVTLSGSRAYVASSSLYAVDISDIYDLSVTGQFDFYGWGRHLAVDQDQVFMMDANAGLFVLWDSGQATPVVETPAPLTVDLSAHPNPFNPRTEINYSVGQAGPVSLAIYDLRGASVAHLVQETQNAGSYSVTWDGQDRFGRSMASGQYFARLKTGVSNAVIKLVLAQ